MIKNLLSAKNHLILRVLFLTLFGMDLSWAEQNPPLPAVTVDEKPPWTAFGLSFIGAVMLPGGAFLAALNSSDDDETSAWLGVSVGAAVIGPSFGYFYSGLNARALIGIAIRASLLLGTMGAASSAEGWAGLGVVLVGSGLVVLAGIIDAALVYPAVKTRNRKLREKTLSISPVLNPLTKAAGITVQIKF